jgi:hypothetical protein
MAVVYKYSLRTGSGSNEAMLTFQPHDKAEIIYQSNWMGHGKKRYILRGEHHGLSELHGVLRLTSIRLEHAAQTIRMDQIYKLITQREFPPGYRKDFGLITFEYLKLPESQVHLARDPDLEFMKYEFFHLADWNDRFDLLLLLHFAYVLLPWSGDLDDHELGNLLHGLDKLKFQSVASDTATPGEEDGHGR